jgi:dTDP-glucose 4,6-dehydratase
MSKYDYDITNLDKLTYCGRLKNCPIDTKIGDITDFYGEYDVIVNFAAESHVDRSILDASSFVKTNILGLNNLLRCKFKKFIQISTDEVYGDGDEISTEESPLRPNNPYAATKASADLLALSYFKTHGTPIIITRSSNNFGKYQYPEKLIPLFVNRLLDNLKVPVYGNGLNIRDWLYVEDNCEAIDIVLHNGNVGEIYNIAGGNELTNIDLTKKILRFLGKDEGSIEFVEDRLGHDKKYTIDCSKIKTLGWKPKHDFDKALEETVAWYKNNKGWYD